MLNITKWRCSHCQYLLEAAQPIEECPSCHNKCAFTDATCYTPECGGPDNIDPKLFEKDKENLS